MAARAARSTWSTIPKHTRSCFRKRASASTLSRTRTDGGHHDLEQPSAVSFQLIRSEFRLVISQSSNHVAELDTQNRVMGRPAGTVSALLGMYGVAAPNTHLIKI